jgi:6-phosphogluconate dehydrogenase (decarboxylating)
LTSDALSKNPTLSGLEAYVADSGEGRWTVFEAIDLNVSAPVITESLDHAQCIWRARGEEGLKRRGSEGVNK